MWLILEEKLDKIIKGKEFKWNFEIKENGIYGIEITASAKSWQQNGLKSFFKDDNLTVKIDNLEFSKKFINWNGNNLKGLKKINLFIVNLAVGIHTLNFLADQNPKIETIRIYQVKNNVVSFLSKDNYPIQEGDRRQWLTIVLCNLGLQSLKIKALAREGRKFLFFQKDDSDLKLIINGEIQKNEEPKSHKNWYWCGRTLKNNLKIFEKELNLKSDLHYIEFWADRNPEIEEIKLTINPETCPIFILDNLQVYAYKGIFGNEDYNRFDKEILEAVNFWNKFFFSQKYPPEKILDPNLIKAMVYIESRIGYESNGEIDVMQVGDPINPALHTLNNDGWIDQATKQISREYEIIDEKMQIIDYHGQANANTQQNSVYWGVRWLCHKAQGITKDLKQRYWKSWEQAVINYNGSDKKYEYQKKVWKIYKKGIDPDSNVLWKNNDKKGFALIKILIVFGVIVVIFLLNWFFWNTKLCNIFCRQKENILSIDESQKIADKIFLKEMEDYKKGKNYVFAGISRKCKESNCIVDLIFYKHYKELVENMRDNQHFLNAVGYLYSGIFYTRDIDNDGENEIIFSLRDPLNRNEVSLVVIDKINNKFQTIEKKIDYGYSGYISLIDLTNDLKPEIAFFVSFGSGGYSLFVYQYKDQKIIELFQHKDLLYPEYIFSDTDKDGLMEIKIKGKIKDALKDYNAYIERVYEYNKDKNDFVKLKIFKEN